MASKKFGDYFWPIHSESEQRPMDSAGTLPSYADEWRRAALDAVPRFWFEISDAPVKEGAQWNNPLIKL